MFEIQKDFKISRRGENIHSALTINAETISSLRSAFRRNILPQSSLKTIGFKDGIVG